MEYILDYCFGWRWLLPYTPGQNICLGGFDEHERAFLSNEMMGGACREHLGHSDGYIIDADHFIPRASDGQSTTIASSGWVAAIGKREAVNNWRRHLANYFPFIREYGLLPSVNPRVVVPLSAPLHTLTALDLHQPGRRLARYGVRLAGLLAQFGIFFPLRHRVLLIASRGAYAPMGAVHAALPSQLDKVISEYALYLGTPDENRKTMVLPFGNFAPELLIKVGNSLKARMALKNEANALIILSKTKLKDRIPPLKGLVENEQCVALYQGYRPRVKVGRKMLEGAVVEFMAELSELDRRVRPLQRIMNEMLLNEDLLSGCEGRSCNTVAWAWLQKQAERGAKVWGCRGHGDFAPWNCMWTEQGLFVYDWEESTVQALAFADAFYYAMATSIHLSCQSTPEKTVTTALDLARQVAIAGKLPSADIMIHFVVWLFLRRNTHPFFDVILNLLRLPS